MGNQPQQNGSVLEQVIEQQPESLLDKIIAKQAEVASRYQPVMSPDDAVKRIVAIKQLKDLVLKEGEDFGVIPGTDKPTLLKPGAEKINAFFGYVPDYSAMAGSIEDWKGERFGEALFYYHVKCTLLKDGAPVGQGTGSCNSWESKYRYRQAKRVCPSCGGAFIIAGKAEYGGGWLCFAKKGGCGAKYAAGDPSIESQQVGRVANPDFADTINTVQKMADKRAYIAATLSATGASQWFTQDMEDQGEPIDTGGHPMNSREAQEYVRDQKIAKQTTSAGNTGSTPPSSQGQKRQGTHQSGQAEPGHPREQSPVPPTNDPPALLDLLERASSTEIKKRLSAFGELKKDIEEATGGDHGYYEVLGNHGITKSNQIKSVKQSQAICRALWDYVARCSSTVAEPPHDR